MTTTLYKCKFFIGWDGPSLGVVFSVAWDCFKGIPM